MVAGGDAHGFQCAERPGPDFLGDSRFIRRDGRRRRGEEDRQYGGTGYKSEMVTRWKKDCVRNSGGSEILLLHEREDRRGSRGRRDAADSDGRLR